MQENLDTYPNAVFTKISYVYFGYIEDNRGKLLKIGITGNLKERLQKHQRTNKIFLYLHSFVTKTGDAARNIEKFLIKKFKKAQLGRKELFYLEKLNSTDIELIFDYGKYRKISEYSKFLINILESITMQDFNNPF